MGSYPTKSELRKLKDWNFSKRDNMFAFLKYLKDCWHYADCGYYELKGKNVLRLRLSTAGWSGNEDRMDALIKNFIFWGVFWQKSERGGHYFFKIDLKTFYPKKTRE